MKRPRRTPQTLVIGSLLILGIILVIDGVMQDAPPVSPQVARLEGTMPRIPVAVDEDTLQVLRYAVHTQDAIAIDGLIEGGEAFSVAQHRQIVILAESAHQIEVRIVDGTQAGRTGWALPRFVQRETPPTSPGAHATMLP